MNGAIRINTPLPSAREEGFAFSGRPRKIEPVASILLRWPTRTPIANEYVAYWQGLAGAALAELRLCRDTLDQIVSHVSRRDGTLRLTDRALSVRSGRSLSSTERDMRRLKNLGFLVSEYVSGDDRQERVRVLRLAVPLDMRSLQRIPEIERDEIPSTYGLCVEGLDMGDCRDV